jgi:hypothetical protein
MKKTTIYIHIGRHKTATTSIQYAFNNNRELFFGKYGIYSSTVGKIDNPNSMANHMLSFEMDKEYPNYKELVQQLEIEISKHKKIFFSSETFGLRPKKIYDFFKEVNADIKIIVYLRKPDEYLESMYKTYVLTPRHSFSGTITDFVYGEPRDDHHSYVRLDENYFDHLKKWESYFGLKNIIVRPFERVQLYKKNIIADILKVMGAESDPSEFEEYFVNTSVSNEAVEIYRSMNFHYHEKGLLRKTFLPGDRFDSLLKGIKGANKTSLFTDKERKEILAKHEIPCRNVAKRYLNIDDSNLFNSYSKPNNKETFDALSADQVVKILIQAAEINNFLSQPEKYLELFKESLL